MKRIDCTLSGVVSSGFKEINAKLGTFKMFVTGTVMHNHNDSVWNFPLPTLISIHLRDFSNLSPEDKYALSVVGTEVKVRVVGEQGSLSVTVESVVGRTRRTLDDFVTAIENCAPQVGPRMKVCVEGDLANKRVRII